MLWCVPKGPQPSRHGARSQWNLQEALRGCPSPHLLSVLLCFFLNFAQLAGLCSDSCPQLVGLVFDSQLLSPRCVSCGVTLGCCSARLWLDVVELSHLENRPHCSPPSQTVFLLLKVCVRTWSFFFLYYLLLVTQQNDFPISHAAHGFRTSVHTTLPHRENAQFSALRHSKLPDVFLKQVLY